MERSPKKTRILIIEDQEDLRAVLTEALNEGGFQTVSSSCGTRGLAIAQERSFDLLILDLRLPGTNGWQILNQLQNRNATPILLLTSSDSACTTRETKRLGACQHLTKPFDLDHLIREVHKLTVPSPAHPSYHS